MKHILSALSAIIKMQFAKSSATVEHRQVLKNKFRFRLNEPRAREFSCAILHHLVFVYERDQDKETLIKRGRRRKKTVVKLRSCNFLLIINNFHII